MTMSKPKVAMSEPMLTSGLRLSVSSALELAVRMATPAVTSSPRNIQR